MTETIYLIIFILILIFIIIFFNIDVYVFIYVYITYSSSDFVTNILATGDVLPNRSRIKR